MPSNPFAVQQTESMKKEFSGMLCNFYIVALTVLLPLYTRGTYVLLGDSKYDLFRNVSLLCLGLAIVVRMAGWLIQTVNMRWIKSVAFNMMDVCMLCYGGCAVISALCSSYGTVAWTGYHEWYMGAVSQLIFVGIYFFVSREYRGSAWPIYLWEMAFFLVIVMGFCSRIGYDPLGLLEGFNSGDWEYSHLISTIGNINWFCGYCTVALAMPVAGYLKGKNLIKKRILFVISVLGLLLLSVQGSDVGPVLMAACLFVCLLWSRRDAECFRRVLLLVSGVAFGLPVYNGMVTFFGETAYKAQPADGPGLHVFGWNGWWLVGLACLGLYLIVGRLIRTESTGQPSVADTDRNADVTNREAIVNGLWLGMVILAFISALAVGAWYLSGLFGSDGWISGRGALWRLSWKGFLRGDWKQKLLGAGPDCFAEYIYSTFAPAELPVLEGYWAEAVFVNAHNQWLNHLVNTGLLGFICAAGIYITALKRYRRHLSGILTLVMYGVNSLVSFQQVMSTPLFFLMLGISEYCLRREKRRGQEKEIKGEI